MPLRITKSHDPIEVTQLVICVYSPPGLGKTSLAFTADRPLLLDFDQGAYRAGNRGDVVQVRDWRDVEGITADDLAPYRTVILDTAGRALDALSADVIRANPKHGRGGALTLQGYGELKSRFIAYLKLMRSFGLDVVLIAHSDEQRNGDDVIERLDVQGGSKQEIYKSADVMGRLSLENGKRLLNFSPTDTAFGKNPAQLPVLPVPHFANEPQFLAGVIAKTKTALNQLTAAQQEVAKLQADWKAKIDEKATLEHFNELLPEVQKADERVRTTVKRLLNDAVGKAGFEYDATAKQFVAPAKQAAA